MSTVRCEQTGLRSRGHKVTGQLFVLLSNANIYGSICWRLPNVVFERNRMFASMFARRLNSSRTARAHTSLTLLSEKRLFFH